MTNQQLQKNECSLKFELLNFFGGFSAEENSAADSDIGGGGGGWG